MNWEAYKDLFEGEDEDIVAAAKARYLARQMTKRDEAKAEEDTKKRKIKLLARG